MKYLVLALCVCAASAASFGSYKPSYQQQQQVAKAVAQAVVVPEYVAPVVAKNYASVPKTVYSGKEADAEIVRYDSEVAADGYRFGFENSNGIAADSVGVLKKVGNDEILVSQGSYKYVSPDGTPVYVSYVADENGYQPQGDVLPVGPAIPEAILRSLEYIRSHPQKIEKY